MVNKDYQLVWLYGERLWSSQTTAADRTTQQWTSILPAVVEWDDVENANFCTIRQMARVWSPFFVAVNSIRATHFQTQVNR